MSEQQTLRVTCEIYSDDRRYHLRDVDATPWFKQASVVDMLRLAECGYGGDYPADEVAHWLCATNGDVANLMDYVTHVPDMGFECRVNRDQARAWVAGALPRPVRVIVDATGGVIESVIADGPAEVLVIDRDDPANLSVVLPGYTGRRGRPEIWANSFTVTARDAAENTAKILAAFDGAQWLEMEDACPTPGSTTSGTGRGSNTQPS